MVQFKSADQGGCNDITDAYIKDPVTGRELCLPFGCEKDARMFIKDLMTELDRQRRDDERNRIS